LFPREGQGRGAPGSSTPWRISLARPGLAARFRVEGNPSIEKESLKIKELEHVLGEKIFSKML
jgi:hypothetical protein